MAKTKKSSNTEVDGYQCDAAKRGLVLDDQALQVLRHRRQV
jgi:hypothetical protein